MYFDTFCFYGRIHHQTNLRPQSVNLTEELVDKCRPQSSGGILRACWILDKMNSLKFSVNFHSETFFLDTFVYFWACSFLSWLVGWDKTFGKVLGWVKVGLRAFFHENASPPKFLANSRNRRSGVTSGDKNFTIFLKWGDISKKNNLKVSIFLDLTKLKRFCPNNDTLS